MLYGKDTLYKNDWTTGDMVIALFAGVALGITVGLLLLMHLVT